MATFTQNYQLHQWDPQDPFLRTDFNQDLQKIDSALADIQNKMDETAETLENQCAMVKVTEINLNSITDRIDIDLSPIDWDQCARLIIFPDIHSDNNSSYYVRLDNIADEVYSGPYLTSPHNWNYMGFFPSNGELQKLELGCTQNNFFLISYNFAASGGQYIPQAITLSRSYLSGSTPSTLNFTKTDGSFSAGTRIRILGIK